MLAWPNKLTSSHLAIVTVDYEYSRSPRCNILNFVSPAQDIFLLAFQFINLTHQLLFLYSSNSIKPKFITIWLKIQIHFYLVFVFLQEMDIVNLVSHCNPRLGYILQNNWETLHYVISSDNCFVNFR